MRELPKQWKPHGKGVWVGTDIYAGPPCLWGYKVMVKNMVWTGVLSIRSWFNLSCLPDCFWLHEHRILAIYLSHVFVPILLLTKQGETLNVYWVDNPLEGAFLVSGSSTWFFFSAEIDVTPIPGSSTTVGHQWEARSDQYTPTSMKPAIYFHSSHLHLCNLRRPLLRRSRYHLWLLRHWEMSEWRLGVSCCKCDQRFTGSISWGRVLIDVKLISSRSLFNPVIGELISAPGNYLGEALAIYLMYNLLALSVSIYANMNQANLYWICSCIDHKRRWETFQMGQERRDMQLLSRPCALFSAYKCHFTLTAATTRSVMALFHVNLCLHCCWIRCHIVRWY